MCSRSSTNSASNPTNRIKVLVIQMERGRITLALPLIATPEPEETFDPDAKLLNRVFRKLRFHQFKHLERPLLVADGDAFNRIEHVVRHQIRFVGLLAVHRTQFCGWCLTIDCCERRD